MLHIGIPDDYADMVRGLPAFAKLADRPVSIWTDAVHEPAALAQRLKNIDALVLVRERTPITAALLSRLPKLKLIAISGPYPNIDVAACTAHGVALSAGGNRATTATPELTWALIMASMRDLTRQVASLQAGRWQTGIGRVLHGQTLGILGFGRIGKAVAGYGRAFGMRVVVWSRERGRAEAAAQGYEIVEDHAELFAQSDVLSVHLRLTPETRGSITRDDLARMKPDALFVNTSRAELLTPGALVEALQAGRPGFAALDVFEDEPVFDRAHPLLQMPNVLATPHLGFVARQPMDEYFSDQFERVLAFERGAPKDIVNPEVLKAAPS
jgi:D-3-phosphoglycerate dehydrogenase